MANMKMMFRKTVLSQKKFATGLFRDLKYSGENLIFYYFYVLTLKQINLHLCFSSWNKKSPLIQKLFDSKLV
jgi:hypothetical protein